MCITLFIRYYYPPKWTMLIHIYHQAMNGPDHGGYSNTMDVEINAWKDKMNDRDIVTHTKYVHVFPYTWYFNWKRYQVGLICILKAHFCVRSDR